MNHLYDEIKPDAKIWPVKPAVVAFDETEYWNFTPEDAPHIERMLGVYLTDRGVGTHLCSFESSYFMEFIDNVLECQPDTPDDVRDRLYDTYEHHYDGSEDHYRECGDVDRYIERHPELAHVFADELPEDATEEARDDVMEGFRDHVRGNAYF